MSTPSPTTPSDTRSVLPTILKTGQQFTLYTRDASTQQIRSSRVLLFLREGTGYGRGGTLFWSHTNTLTEIPSQKLLLHMLLDMRCGRLSSLFQSDALPQKEKVLDNRCFTLRTATVELNLEAQTHEQREVWWNGILKKLEQAGRQLMNSTSNGGVAGGGVDKTDKSPSLTSVPAPSTPSQPVTTSSSSSVSAASPAPLHPTHRHQSSLSSVAYAGVLAPAQVSPTSRSASSSTNSSSLNTNPSPPPYNQNHSPPVGGAGATRESTPSELRAFLTNGVVARKWDFVSSAPAATADFKDVHATPIVLFAEGRGRSGSLYWVVRDASLAPNAPITPAERASLIPPHGSPTRIPLDAITDFMLRKKALPLKASPAPSECCFALVYSTGHGINSEMSLNLEATSQQEAKMAKEAIITMLTTAGKQVVKANSGTTSTGGGSASPALSSASSASSTPTMKSSKHVGFALPPPAPTTTVAAASPVSASSSAPTPTRTLFQNVTPSKDNPIANYSVGTPAPGTPANAAASSSSSSAASLPPPVSVPADSPLLHGGKFMLYTCPESGQATAQEIFVWFATPSDSATGGAAPNEKPGVLSYIITQSHTGLPITPVQTKFTSVQNQRFVLSSLKQMQIGRECTGFKTLSINQVTLPPSYRTPNVSNELLNPACCWSIVFKTGVMHLECLSSSSASNPIMKDRETIREQWIKSIHNIMLEYTKYEKARKAVIAAQNAQNAATPTSAVVVHAQQQHQQQIPVRPSSASAASPSSASTPSTPSITASPSSHHIHNATSMIDMIDVPHPSLLKGQEFVQYFHSTDASGVDHVEARQVVVWLDVSASGGEGKYALCYSFDTNIKDLSPSSRPEVPLTQRLSLNTIQRLVAGKTQGAFKLSSSNPTISALSPERCLCIMSKLVAWNLVAGTHEQREGFMKNLHLSMLKFRKPSNGAGGASSAAAGAGANAVSAVSSNVQPNNHYGSTPPLSTPSPSLQHQHPAAQNQHLESLATAIEFMTRSHQCKMYRFSTSPNSSHDHPDVISEDVLVSFESVAFHIETLSTTPGIMFYSPASSSSSQPSLNNTPESRRLYLNRMNQMIGGKESTVFQHPSCAKLMIDRCFTIHFTVPLSVQQSSSAPASSSQPQQWNIECETHAMREQWISAIHSIMTRYGREKAEYKQKMGLPANTPLKASVAAAQAAGNNNLFPSSSSPVLSSPHSSSPLDLNRLTHSSLDNTTVISKSLPNALQLTSFSSAGGDGQSGMRETAGGQNSDFADTKIMHARTPAHAQQHGGNGDDDEYDGYSPSDSPDNPVFAAMAGGRNATRHIPHAGAAGGDDSASDNRSVHRSLEAEPDVLEAFLSTGCVFTLFTPGQPGSSSTKDTKKDIFLFFQSAIGSETPGSLFWNAHDPLKPPVKTCNPDNKFLLNTIKQMRAGKETSILQSGIARDYGNDCCLTLINSTLTLNLAAKDSDTRDTFMKGIHSIVVQNGMKARESVTEMTQQPNANGGGAPVHPPNHGAGGSNASHHHHQKSNSQPPGLLAAAASAAANSGSHSPATGSPIPSAADRAHRLPTTNFLSHSTNKTINFSDPTQYFILQQKIGEGSYGAVYKAMDLRTGRACAIKIISFNGIDSSKLRNEIRVLKSCSSPYIISYISAFQRNEYVWIVTELCSGGSLSDMMMTCRHTFSENQIAVVMKQTLRGLQYLHTPTEGKKIIIHRDIKGGNILVTAEGQMKLADFGVSGSLDESLGKHRTVIGTPHWMAPEVLLSDNYNELVDIWSLGITAYELAVGQPPHAELHSLRAALKIPMVDPPTLPHPERYSKELHSFIACCLVKDYTKRPSATELLQHPFITKNLSTPQLLLEMVGRTIASIESRAAKDGDDAGAIEAITAAMALPKQGGKPRVMSDADATRRGFD